MISESHNTSHILYWFFEFIRLFDDVPKVFISDMSTVLLNAAANAFGNFANISEYINRLFDMIQNANGLIVPKCYIRIDINHLVKNITTCDALKLKSAEHKQFLIRSTCLLISCTSLEKARKILYSILIVAKSAFKGTGYVTSFLLFYNFIVYCRVGISNAQAIS